MCKVSCCVSRIFIGVAQSLVFCAVLCTLIIVFLFVIFHLTIALSIIRFTTSDYPFAVFNLVLLLVEQELLTRQYNGYFISNTIMWSYGYELMNIPIVRNYPVDANVAASLLLWNLHYKCLANNSISFNKLLSSPYSCWKFESLGALKWKSIFRNSATH
jgi:hypothetical protein